jgi:L-ribulose-5-phosphate 4-epimerase
MTLNNEIRKRVLQANLDLLDLGLVCLTWGNASAVDRQRGVMWIKPSGIEYNSMSADQIVEVDLNTGEHLGNLKPSSDTATHLSLYKHFPDIGGIVHTHSSMATSWAQACLEIPCMGTTHADHFNGSVPLTRRLHPEEIKDRYEHHTGQLIIERFKGIDPLHFPGVLVAEHGPFTWGKTIQDAVTHAVILEEIAKMAYQTQLLGKHEPIQKSLLEKHFQRKHGPQAYYGQNNNT